MRFDSTPRDNQDTHEQTPQRRAASPRRQRPSRLPEAESFWENDEPLAPVEVPRTQSPQSIIENNTIVPSADSRGATVTMSFKISPAAARAISAAVESKRFGLTCAADLIRIGVYRFLQDLAAVNGNVKTAMALVNMQRDTLSSFTVQSEIDDLFEQTVQLCRTFIETGEGFEARRLALSFKSRVDAMEESVWKRRVLDRFDEDLGFVFDAEQAEAIARNYNQSDSAKQRRKLQIHNTVAMPKAGNL